MTCFLSAFCFGSSVFYFYQYALYLEHEKNNGGIR
uniref:Uncharacterized protein n=1 Tax=Steinernema glaseri TaxID=37863 RepID=A0A1I7XXW9_9BILA